MHHSQCCQRIKPRAAHHNRPRHYEGPQSSSWEQRAGVGKATATATTTSFCAGVDKPASGIANSQQRARDAHLEQQRA